MTYGHWGGDTVHGAGKSGYITTFVERNSGYLLAYKLVDTSSLGFAETAKQCLAYIPPKYRKSPTLNNDS